MVTVGQMKIAILVGALALYGCAAIDRTLTKYEDWPHNLMPRAIRSDGPHFDSLNYDIWWPNRHVGMR